MPVHTTLERYDVDFLIKIERESDITIEKEKQKKEL